MTNDRCFEIAFKTLASIAFMHLVKVFLKRLLARRFVSAKATPKLNVVGFDFRGCCCCVLVMLSIDMCHQAGLGYGSVCAMFTFVTFNFAMLNINMTS